MRSPTGRSVVELPGSVGTFDEGSHILPTSVPDTANKFTWCGVLTITTETDLNFTIALAQSGGREVKHRDRTD